MIAKDFDGLAKYLAGLIANMAAGGAEFSAIVAATPHICAAQLAAISPVPLINMLTEVQRAVSARGLQRVALLGTRFTLETRMFGCLGGIETVMPEADEKLSESTRSIKILWRAEARMCKCKSYAKSRRHS